MFYDATTCLCAIRDALALPLISLAAAAVVSSFLALCRERPLFARELAAFRQLTPVARFAVVALLCFVTRWAGSKPEGAPSDGGSEANGVPSPSLNQATPLRLPVVAGTSTPGLRITAFSVDCANASASFEVGWPSNFFADATSRDLHFFSCTNLLDRTWTPLTSLRLPADATSISFAVTTNTIPIAARRDFLNAFSGRGFFTFATECDSDGDGLNDFEELPQGLNPRNSLDAMQDSDDDGIPNLYEIRNGSNPVVSDWERIPKLTIGEGTITSLKQALNASRAYSIIVLPPGVWAGSEWTGLHFPPHPVLVTSADRGYDRRTIIRHTASHDLAAFYLDKASSTHTVLQGFTLDMGEAGYGFNAGVWCGGNTPFGGEHLSATFRNLYVRLPPTDAINVGFFCRHAVAGQLNFAGCVVNANGSWNARGIYIIDGSPTLVENCSFLNFPVATGFPGYAIQFESTSQNRGCASDPVPVEISNCLFDESFTNAIPIALLDNGVAYDIRLHHSLMPSPPTNAVVSASMVFTNAMPGASGMPDAESPARGMGTAARLSLHDANDNARGAASDIGAYQYAQVVAAGTDTDNDGIGDMDEVGVYLTDPLLWDTDGDGQSDYDEIFILHTDPLSNASFHARLMANVHYVCDGLPDTTNYICHGYSDAGWEGLDQCCTDTNAVFNYEFDSTGRAVYLKLFVDINRNGEYDAGADWLKVERVPLTGGAGTVIFNVGDLDGDGQGDLYEYEHGGDPLSKSSFAVCASVTVNYKFEGLSCLTNYVCHGYSATGWEGLGQQCTTTNATYLYEFTSHGEHVYVKLFVDDNANGAYDRGVDVLQSAEVKIGNEPASVVFNVGDADGDGLGDLYEVERNTDPLDKKSIFVRVHVTVGNGDADYASVANYLAYGFSSGRWETNGLRSFTGQSFSHDYSFITTNGQAYVKVLRDFNGNGFYDEGIDALYSQSVKMDANGICNLTMTLGDADGDGVLDSEEDADGTDKFDLNSYCREVSVNLSGGFKAENYLSMALATNSTEVIVPLSGIVFVTNRQMHVSYPCLRFAKATPLYLVFFDDLDGDGVREADETVSCSVISATKRHVAVDLAIPKGPFDADGDEILDWWENAHGLDPGDPADAYADDDGDGLVNLHEFWAGCDPFTPDGTNSLLAVMAKSIDDRLAAANEPAISLPIYSNYGSASSAYDLVENTNCWAYGIDFSCCSMWNSFLNHKQYAATAISPRHIVLAEHFDAPLNITYYFKGTNNVIYSSVLIRKKQILNTDIEIGLLDSPLPDAVMPAKILPVNFETCIGTAKGLPVITLNQEEKALVHELDDLPTDRFGVHSGEAYGQEAHSAARKLFYEKVVGGDSSNPRFLVVGNELMFLLTLFHGGSGSGPLLPLYKEEIQAAMDYLCPEDHYEVQEYDFGNYDQLPSTWEDL